MSGVVFIICIPTEEQEHFLLKNSKSSKKVTIEENMNIKDKIIITHHKSSSDLAEITNILKEVKNSTLTTGENNLRITSKYSEEILYKSSNDLLEKKQCKSMQKDILEQLDITNSTWCKANDNNYLQIMFHLESRDRSEEILEILKEHQIGKLFSSVVSVIPCSIHYNSSGHESKEPKCCGGNRESQEKDTAWHRFIASVRARSTVGQIVENVKNRASLTFDFICLILISTMLCAIGLVENSNVYLLSSMLISPMMGPVMAGTFGTVIQDKRLQKMGVQNELIGLGIATLVGFGYGSVICIFTNKYGVQEWPTGEMLSRGELRTLWVGCLIALLSGAAVALGILSDNIASLVGVAISTSLMPPAVNAGLLWSIASIYYVKGNETTRYSSLAYTDYYSQNRAVELLALGAVSICLTFVNIICIYLSGILVLKIKEVAPIASRDKARRQFWKHDIKFARDYNKILQNDEISNNNWESIRKDCDENKSEAHLFHHSMDLSRENAKITVPRSEYTWSPCMDTSKRPSIDELKLIYATLMNKNSQNVARNLNFYLPSSKCNPSCSGRRLSQIFSPANLGKSEEKLDTIVELPQNQVFEKNPEDKVAKEGTRTKKFVVTPCDLENLK